MTQSPPCSGQEFLPLEANDVHVWSLSSTWHAASAHVVVPDQMVGQSAGLIARLTECLHERGIDHPTFQLEVGDCGPGEGKCG